MPAKPALRTTLGWIDDCHTSHFWEIELPTGQTARFLRLIDAHLFAESHGCRLSLEPIGA